MATVLYELIAAQTAKGVHEHESAARILIKGADGEARADR
jgi:hypothetical protein